jgi:tetratricopeptide (TPR) repeat protein
MSLQGRRPSRTAAPLVDIARLLRNALPHGDVSGEVEPSQAAALQAVDRLRAGHENGERLHAIVSRCDMQGESHKVVAGNLGLSRSQFYRDLAQARQIIAEEIRASMARELSGPTIDGTPFGTRLQTAISLAGCGHGKAAVAYFTPVVATLTGAERIWGHAVLAELFLGDGDFSAAERELQRAFSLDDDESGLGLARALLAKAALLHETGHESDASACLERAVKQVESHAAASRSPLARDTLSTALSNLTFCYFERFDLNAAVRTHAKNPASSEGAFVSPAVRMAYLKIDAMLACDSSAGPARAREACSAFHRFAVAHGLLDEISHALLQLGGVARIERRLDDAQRLAQESLELQYAIGRRNAPALSMLSCIAFDKGEYDDAVRLARKTRAESPSGSQTWWHSHLSEAEALAQAGRHDEARAICDRVRHETGDRDARISAWSRRVEARIFERLGNESAAYRAAGSALEILGKDAPPFYRLKSLLIAQHLRPARSQREQIRGLAAVLGWSAPGT